MYLTIDMGGTFIKYALMYENGQISEKGKIPTLVEKDEIIASMAELYAKYKDQGIQGIAMSVPGLIDVENGIMVTAGAIKQLYGCHMAEELSAACDGIKVSVENDGKAAALAEAWMGAAKDVPNCYVLGFGTGIAGAAILNKKALRGPRLIAGEASNFPVIGSRKAEKPVKFAHYSTIGVVKEVGAMVGDPDFNGEKLFELYKAGNEQVVEAVEDWFYMIAMQCNYLQLVVDPDVICIGGGISAEPLFIEGIQRWNHIIYQQMFGEGNAFPEPVIARCQFSNDSNLIGALYNFKQLYPNV